MDVLVVAALVIADDRLAVEGAAIRLDSRLVEKQRSSYINQLTAWVHGRVLVAYQLPLVQSLLKNEYQRSGCALDAGQGLDLQLEAISLTDACEREGITLSGSGAMSRAEAAAELLRRRTAKDRQSLAGTTPARVTK